MLVTGSSLFGKMVYDPSGGSAWLADVFDTAAVEHLTFKSAENIAGMTLTPIPYELSLAGAKAHWTATPIGMRGADNVLVRVSGMIVEPGGGSDPITLVLKNSTASY